MATSCSREDAPQHNRIYEILFIFVLMGEVRCQNIWFVSHANYSWGGGARARGTRKNKRKKLVQKVHTVLGALHRELLSPKRGARALPGAAPAFSAPTRVTRETCPGAPCPWPDVREHPPCITRD